LNKIIILKKSYTSFLSLSLINIKFLIGRLRVNQAEEYHPKELIFRSLNRPS